MQSWSLSLPWDLTLAICEDLNLNDLKQMRLTCRAFANEVAPTVLSHVTISAREITTVEELISNLQFLTNPKRVAVHCSREITFGDLSSIFPDAIEDDHVKMLSEEFLTAFTSFKIVQTVNWCTWRNDPFWLQEVIWKAITKFPNLRHLKMNSLFLKQPLENLDSLDTLESIKIDGSPFVHDGALFLSLSKLYASSSNLNSITIDDQYEHGIEISGAHALQDLLSSSPRENPAHRLRRLALCNVPIRLDEFSISHLTNLTSFKLSSLLDSFDYGGFSSSPDDIWDAFERAKIRLQELEVGSDAVVDSLNDYLSSFSGLKKLWLSIPRFGSQEISEASAIKFWSDGFPNHVDTLQDFSLRACYDGQWCFGRHNRSLIEKCTKLEQLTISLLPEDIPTKAESFNDIGPLIDMVVTHLPRVKDLGMVVPGRESHRGHRCGISTYAARIQDRNWFADWVPKYQPPAHCQSLPRLTVRGLGSVKVYVGIKDAQRSRLEYLRSV